jgi:hypothetical protein
MRRSAEFGAGASLRRSEGAGEASSDWGQLVAGAKETSSATADTTWSTAQSTDTSGF